MTTDLSLAQASNTLVYSAMLVYTGAMVAFAVDLSGRGGVGRRAASRGAASAAAVPAPEPELVGAAGEPVPRADGSFGSASESDGGSRGDAGGGRPAPGHSRAAGIALALFVLAAGLHVAAVAARGLSVHRAPWGNMYEFALTGSAVVAVVYLGVLLVRDLAYLGLFVAGPILLTLGLAISVFYADATQLLPALRSYWLLIHVSVAFVASALFTLGFSTSVLQVVKQRREAAAVAGSPPRGGRFMDALPASADLEHTAYRLHVVAFPLWTFAVLAGAIWAEAAWGRYWGWDPKEVWSFVIWVVYAGYLHARVTRGWDGTKAASLAFAGYGCVLFNFLVVNIFFVGHHAYSGV